MACSFKQGYMYQYKKDTNELAIPLFVYLNSESFTVYSDKTMDNTLFQVIVRLDKFFKRWVCFT